MDALQSWIAEVFESEASWRRQKAEEHPDDPRNLSSAVALEGAASYVRGLESPSPGLRLFIALQDELDHADRYATEPEALVGSGGRRVSRFGFDAGPVDYEHALRALFDDAAEGWSESLANSGNQPPRGLVEYFDGIGFPLWLEEDEE